MQLKDGQVYTNDKGDTLDIICEYYYSALNDNCGKFLISINNKSGDKLSLVLSKEEIMYLIDKHKFKLLYVFNL